MTTMPQSSVLFFGIASVGPAVAAVAQAPEAIMQGATGSALTAVGFMLWRVGNAILGQMKEMHAHRERELQQWQQESSHREAERDHWRAHSGTTA